jgi:lambda family phage portal protein
MNDFAKALKSISSISSIFTPRFSNDSAYRAYGYNSKADIEKFFREDLEDLFKSKGKRSFGFEAAWYDRTNSNWVAWRSSLDAILRTSIWILVGRCRDLQRTNSIVSRALNLWKNNVVGAHGVRLRMNMRNDDGSPQTAINKAISDNWRWFGHAENLTPAADMDMVQFQKHIFSTVPIDGTCLIRIFKGRQYPYGIAFRILELDLLDTNKFTGRPADSVEVKFGIETNRDSGKILAYWLYLSNPNDLSLAGSYTAGKSFRVPADEVILVMKKERPLQTIGIPWFVRAMVNLHILQSFTKATLIKAQMVASYFVFIENTLAVQESDDSGTGDPNGFQQMPVDNGVSLELKKGQTVKNLAPSSAGSDFESIFKWALRFISGDLDLSYHALSGDTSQGNYASLRMEALEERAGHIGNQVWLATAVLRPMFREWLKIQHLTQKFFQVSEDLLMPLIYAAEWIGRRWDWVDPKNESTAAVALVNAALMSRTRYAKEHDGAEIDDHIGELAYEQVRLEEEGIVIQTTSGQQLEFGQTDPQTPGKPAAGDGKTEDDPDDE